MVYEIMVMYKPLLPDDVRKGVHKDILALMEEVGGEVEDVDVWGKRYLAYKIKGHNEGYYIVYQVDIPSDSVSEVNRKLRLKQEILRYVVTKITDKAEIGKKLKKKNFSID
ncbi:30S ribosomal protein S6 [Candidatus Dojkabacteria bacterium]|nr:30S ribosomal protein S6 [Candidatus Dojkabacteria bacterium]